MHTQDMITQSDIEAIKHKPWYGGHVHTIGEMGNTVFYVSRFVGAICIETRSLLLFATDLDEEEPGGDMCVLRLSMHNGD